MLKYLIAVFLAFYGLIWTADRYGGLCDTKPVIIAIVVFIAVMVFVIVLSFNTDTPLRSNVLGATMALGTLIAVLTAVHVSSSIKSEANVDGVGTSVGVANGIVTDSIFWVENNRSHINKRDTGCEVTYTYQVGASHYSQCDYFSKRRLFKRGQHVKVLYLLARPYVARLLKPDESLPDTGSPDAGS